MATFATAFAPALKVHYTRNRLMDLTYQGKPFLAMVNKDETFKGANLPIPCHYVDPQGRSATFSTAVTNNQPSGYISFILTRVSNYTVASIDRQTMIASDAAPIDAWVKARFSEIDAAIHALAVDMSHNLFRDSFGSYGQVSNSSFAVTTLTLVTARDVVHFEVNQVIVVSAQSNGTALRAGSLTISGIDRVAGTLTTTQNLSTGIAAIAQNDFIYIQGDATFKAAGLNSWLPFIGSRPVPGDNFFGVDRSVDGTRLAGVAYDGSGQTIEEAIVDGLALLNQESGGIPDVCFMNFRNWSNLEKALGSRVRYMDVKLEEVRFGFHGIQLNGPMGPLMVLADRSCQDDRAYILDMDTWTMFSAGPAPHIVDEDGTPILRNPNTDQFDLRVASYWQLGCTAPGRNAVVKLPVG